MELSRLIEALSEPASYPFPVDAVEVRQTHISAVFLVGSWVYKVKKPVSLGFLDFATLEKRRHFCEEEVRLNRRLAPDVYRGVVPITQVGGSVRMEGTGEAVEWAVKMERLPESATLLERVRRDDVATDLVETLAERLADFHARAASNPATARYGRLEAVAANVRDNLPQSLADAGGTLSRVVFERLRARIEGALADLGPLIERRALEGRPRDTHGDLHLDHVYYFPDRPPPRDLVIVDCIEFNERFRFIDPVADMAFLVMDLKFQGHRDLATAFAQAYFRFAGAEEGRDLLHFYTAYRAAVRAKVEGIELGEKEIPRAEQEAAFVRARGHWLLALSELEHPERRPCLVLVGGLPGSGKSTLARGLQEPAGFRVIRSDAVRKELARIAGTKNAPIPFGSGIYTDAWTERTYSECLRRAETMLFEGERVLIDASFASEKKRRAFLDAAVRLGVVGVFLTCRAKEETIRPRLEQRTGDLSDADWSVYLQTKERWEPPAPATERVTLEISTDAEPGDLVRQALTCLREFEVMD